jgi:hypothetical protein
MDSGRITEQGTYADLLQANKGFSKLIADFGSHKEEKQDDDVKPAEREKKDRTAVKPGAKLMQDEERETGALSWDVYKVGPGTPFPGVHFVANLSCCLTALCSVYGIGRMGSNSVRLLCHGAGGDRGQQRLPRVLVGAYLSPFIPSGMTARQLSLTVYLPHRINRSEASAKGESSSEVEVRFIQELAD